MSEAIEQSSQEATNPFALSVEGIDLHYGAAQALRNISLDVETKKITCVLGRNGVGKSSMLRAIVGQHPVSKGKIILDGTDVTKAPPYVRAGRGHRLCAAGARDLSAVDRQGKS